MDKHTIAPHPARDTDADPEIIYNAEHDPVGYVDRNGRVHLYANVHSERDANGSTDDYAESEQPAFWSR